jgi:hypothetical protein
MPRGKTATRRRAEVKRPMTSRQCGQPIEVGQTFYYWQKRYQGKSFVHTSCGYPKPTMLSNRKTAQIEEAIQDSSITFSPSIPPDWDGNPETIDIDHGDVTTVLEEIASVARDVGSEYEMGVDIMPEGLQYGPTGEAMREVAQELESWADDLESFEPSRDTPDWPERDDDDEDDEEWERRVEEALENWASDVVTDAEDKLGEMPEYQG